MAGLKGNLAPESIHGEGPFEVAPDAWKRPVYRAVCGKAT